MRSFKKIIPSFLKTSLRNLVPLYDYYQKVRLKIFCNHISSHKNNNIEYLDFSDIEKFDRLYPPHELAYERGQINKNLHKELFKRIPKLENLHAFLELGCGDGNFSASLQNYGKDVTAIDTTNILTKYATESGMKFYEMDASDLSFPAESFDCVLSFAAFEHFDSIEKVILNILKVLKKDGLCYITFGPLYNAPFGLHAYTSLGIPYCQFLFKQNDIQKFIHEKGRGPLGIYVNKYTLAQYRNLWEMFKENIKVLKYREILNLDFREIVEQYPDCFLNKHKDLHEFFISSVEILFRKK